MGENKDRQHVWYVVDLLSGKHVMPGYATKAQAEAAMQYILQQARFLDDYYHDNLLADLALEVRQITAAAHH